MSLDTATLVLSGDVLLTTFAKAIGHFHSLLTGLSTDAGSPEIEWVIDALERSSTLATVRGVGDPARVTRVVEEYVRVGDALEGGAPLTKYSPRVRRAASGLRAIPGGKVESVRFETAEREVILRPERPGMEPPTLRVAGPESMMGVPRAAYGAIEGRVQTLTSRGGLRFTLYDLLHDRAVSCYLKEGYEDIMRDAWGKVALVKGWVSRDPHTGRPLTIRQVTTVRVHSESRATFRDARGALPAAGGELPEHVIRRLRDA